MQRGLLKNFLKKFKALRKVSNCIACKTTASAVYWSEFLATDPEAPGSIPGTARFAEN
jgi:hypothetical protein